MTISKLVGIVVLILIGSSQLIAQNVQKEEKKIIRITSTADLAELDKIFAPNEVIDRSDDSKEEEEALAALAGVYTAAQQEQDALDKEQEQLVDWYFDSPKRTDEPTPNKKKEVIPSKK